MIGVSQNILLFSSRLGSGWLRSESTGMPERTKARRSSATVDMATRLPKRGAGDFLQRLASVLSRPGCQERFDHRVELSRAARMKIMTTIHRDITCVGYPPRELGQSVLAEMAVGAPDNQGGQLIRSVIGHQSLGGLFRHRWISLAARQSYVCPRPERLGTSRGGSAASGVGISSSTRARTRSGRVAASKKATSAPAE